MSEKSLSKKLPPPAVRKNMIEEEVDELTPAQIREKQRDAKSENQETSGVNRRQVSVKKTSNKAETASVIDQDDLEINFQQEISKIQQYYFQICKKLMLTYIGIMVLQLVFAIYQLIDCGCFGSSGNNLICVIHYVKVFLNVWLTQKYYYNIRDYQSTHPVSNINTFFMMTFYFGMLFVYLDSLDAAQRLSIYLIGIYPATDFAMILICISCVKKSVIMKRKLEENPLYSMFKSDIQTKLREILYLPITYQSDIEEDQDID